MIMRHPLPIFSIIKCPISGCQNQNNALKSRANPWLLVFKFVQLLREPPLNSKDEAEIYSGSNLFFMIFVQWIKNFSAVETNFIFYYICQLKSINLFFSGQIKSKLFFNFFYQKSNKNIFSKTIRPIHKNQMAPTPLKSLCMPTCSHGTRIISSCSCL